MMRVERERIWECVSISLRLAHVSFSLVLLSAALIEFASESPYFDMFQHPSVGSKLLALFRNVSGQPLHSVNCPCHNTFRRIMDFPTLVLFGGRGVWALLVTMAILTMICTFISVNLWAGQFLDWRFFRDCVISIILNVFSISMAYSVTMVAVFNSHNWFPFRIMAQELPEKDGLTRALLVVWNVFVLILLLALCLLIWFSRLYTSWACVRSVDEVLLLCQFTVLVQCWSCEDAALCTGLDACVRTDQNPYHCMSPLPSANGGVKAAFCLFNYNIGPFTFITVFAYVGGMYFFTRTTLNGAVNTVRIILHLTVLGTRQLLRQPKSHPPAIHQSEDSPSGSELEEDHQQTITLSHKQR